MTAVTDERIVALFNRNWPIGTPILFWPGDRVGDGHGSRTRSQARLLGGHTPVVWVEGFASCIALTHVEVPQ